MKIDFVCNPGPSWKQILCKATYHEKQTISPPTTKKDLWLRYQHRCSIAQPLTSHQPGIASLTGSALRFSETCFSHLADIGVFVASTQLQSLHPSFLLTSRPQPAIISLSSSLRFPKVSFNIPTLNKCFKKKKKERKKHPHRHAASNSCEVFLHLGNRLRAGNRISICFENSTNNPPVRVNTGKALDEFLNSDTFVLVSVHFPQQTVNLEKTIAW